MSWYRMFMALKRNGAKTENELKKKESLRLEKYNENNTNRFKRTILDHS